MRIRQLASPNFDSRNGWVVDTLVLHYTDTRDLAEALSYLMNPQAQVSSHYVVDVNGDVLQLVDESQRAWHAGKSFWRGWTNLNQRSIGIEIVNAGHRYGPNPFPRAQMEAVAQLCQAILARHAIEPRNVVAHSDIAPARKQDPGELFDWKFLASQGVGLWPENSKGRGARGEKEKQKVSSTHHSPLTTHHDLADYGYDITDEFAAIAAFQRRYRAQKIDGKWDAQCAALLAALLQMV